MISFCASSSTILSSDPSDALTVFPLSVFLMALAGNIHSLTMLFTALPIAFVAATIRPDEFTVALLFIVYVFTDILPTISPGESTLPMHFVVAPFALVLAAIGPSVYSLSVDVVIIELSDVHRSISPLESTGSVFLPVFVIALVFGTVWPGFYTKPMLFILTPFTGILSTVHVNIRAPAMRLVVEPLSLIDITIRVD